MDDVVINGLYRHYKGKIYIVSAIAVSATNGEEGRAKVIYYDPSDPNGKTHPWERLYEEFVDEIINPKYPGGGKEALPWKIKRFEHIGGIDMAVPTECVDPNKLCDKNLPAGKCPYCLKKWKDKLRRTVNNGIPGEGECLSIL